MSKLSETSQKIVKILIVEDSPTQLEGLRFLLEEWGYKVATATDGKKGLAVIRANDIDLVISDIVMPEMDGYMFCKALREDENLKHIPVILLTSLTDPRDVIKGLESGANNFICKPYDDRVLIARVQNILANQEIRKAAPSEMGITIFFAGQRFFITADRLQILDLLLSTYENAVSQNSELTRIRDDLRTLNKQLEARVTERTAALAAEVKEHKMSREREHQLNCLLRAIRDVNQLIVREKDPERLIRRACEILVETRGYRAVWIALNGMGGMPVLVAQSGWGETFDGFADKLRNDILPSCWTRVRVSEKGFTILDPKMDCDDCLLREVCGQNAASVALINHEEIEYGILGLCLLHGEDIDKDEEDLILEVAGDLGLALHGLETERKRMSYAQIVASSQDAMALVDCGYVYLEANPSYARLVGCDKARIVGHQLSEVLGEAVFLDIVKPNMDKCFQGKTVSFETLRNVPGLGSRFVEVQYSPCYGSDGSIHSIAVSIRDITLRKNAEAEREKLEEQLRASQKMEAVGSLAGGIAHDFNNLLSVIMGYTDFAIEGLRDDDSIVGDLMEVKKASQSAVILTRQLLAFSRKQVMQPALLNLNRTVEGLEKMLRRILGEDLDLVQILAPDLGFVMADPGQMEQVLMNLVVNARDAMPTGGKLTIETSNVEIDSDYTNQHVAMESGSYVQLAVTDTGYGMDAKTMERIFEPFFTTKEKGKGTGLGLSMVYGIVKQSGGNIWVYSEPGQGTTFKIYLPQETSDHKPVTNALTQVKRRLGGTETILLVEDEDAVRKLTERILSKAGYKMLTATDGEEAIKLNATYPGEIHLVLTDIVMPKMSGKTLANRLTAERSGIKVLYMSGFTDNAIQHHGVLDKGIQFISKPFNPSDLLEKIREVLDVPDKDSK